MIVYRTLGPLVLAHPIQRLIGELIVYPCSGVHPSSSSVTISDIFSEIASPIKAKFYAKPLGGGGGGGGGRGGVVRVI